MTPKTNFKKLVNPDYMGAYSMDDGLGGYFEIDAVIKKITQEEVADPTGKKKMCLIGYTDQPKPFIINATAQKVLTLASKSRYIEDWPGVNITFYVALNVRTPQGPTDALRIKARMPKSNVDYTPQIKVLEACTTMLQLQQVYTSLTKEQQAATVTVKDQMKAKLTPNA